MHRRGDRRSVLHRRIEPSTRPTSASAPSRCHRRRPARACSHAASSNYAVIKISSPTQGGEPPPRIVGGLELHLRHAAGRHDLHGDRHPTHAGASRCSRLEHERPGAADDDRGDLRLRRHPRRRCGHSATLTHTFTVARAPSHLRHARLHAGQPNLDDQPQRHRPEAVDRHRHRPGTGARRSGREIAGRGRRSSSRGGPRRPARHSCG